MSGIEIALIGGTVLSAIGAVQQGNQLARQYREQAAVADYNAAVAERDARQAMITASARQEQFRQQARRELGRQRAAQAESGLAAAGSVLGVLDQSAVDAEMDALLIGHEGELQARALRERGALDSFEAGIHRRSARDARAAGFVAAGTRLLSGVAEAYKFRQLRPPQAEHGAQGATARPAQKRGNQTPSHGR